VRSGRPHAVAASASSRQSRTAARRRIGRPTVREAGDGCAGRRDHHPGGWSRLHNFARFG
jgi:hypothetical protein